MVLTLSTKRRRETSCTFLGTLVANGASIVEISWKWVASQSSTVQLPKVFIFATRSTVSTVFASEAIVWTLFACFYWRIAKIFSKTAFSTLFRKTQEESIDTLVTTCSLTAKNTVKRAVLAGPCRFIRVKLLRAWRIAKVIHSQEVVRSTKRTISQRGAFWTLFRTSKANCCVIVEEAIYSDAPLQGWVQSSKINCRVTGKTKISIAAGMAIVGATQAFERLVVRVKPVKASVFAKIVLIEIAGRAGRTIVWRYTNRTSWRTFRRNGRLVVEISFDSIASQSMIIELAVIS